jgi:hypothetical protein
MENLSPKNEAIEELSKLKEDATFEDISNLIYNLDKENQVWISEIGRKVFTVAGVFAVLSLVILLSDWCKNWGYEVCLDKAKLISDCKDADKLKLPYFHGIIYAGWVIGPPIWFFYEYVWHFPAKLKMSSKHRDELKLTQELASKVWAALIIIFGAILYLKYGQKL